MKHKERPERPDGTFGLTDALTLGLFLLIVGVLIAGSGLI